MLPTKSFLTGVKATEPNLSMFLSVYGIPVPGEPFKTVLANRRE